MFTTKKANVCIISSSSFLNNILDLKLSKDKKVRYFKISNISTGEFSFLKKQQIDLFLYDFTSNKADYTLCVNKILSINPEAKIIGITSEDKINEFSESQAITLKGYLLTTEIANIDIPQIILSINNNGVWLGNMFYDLALRFLQNRSKLISNQTQNKNIYNLTEREIEVLNLVVKGLSNAKIAKALFISSHTAKVHVSNILRKLNVTDRVQAAVIACKCNLC